LFSCHNIKIQMKYSFTKSASEYLPNQLFPSNKSYRQKFFYGERNRSFSRYNYQGDNTYQQPY
jgi:hypothetical protein